MRPLMPAVTCEHSENEGNFTGSVPFFNANPFLQLRWLKKIRGKIESCERHADRLHNLGGRTSIGDDRGGDAPISANKSHPY